MISPNLSAIFYLVSGVLFILALRGHSPETSRQGNLFGILGMVIAFQLHFYQLVIFQLDLYLF